MEEVVIPLDQMNAKQKQKEFKSTQKDLKSKDMVVKMAALHKLKDLTYIKEGGCLSVFLQTLFPKKKNVDYVLDALVFFSELLTPLRNNTVDQHAFWMGMEPTFSSNMDVNTVLGGLLECLVFKEEIKKPKKTKNAIETPFKEDVRIVAIRSKALNIIYSIMFPLLCTSLEDPSRLIFSSLPNLTVSLLDLLHQNYGCMGGENPSTDGEFLQNCIYAITTFVFVMRTNSQAIKDFVSHPISGLIASIVKHPLLSVAACQILQIITIEDVGLDYLSSNIEVCLETLEISTKCINDLAAPPVEVVPVKGKDPKKDDKGKKNAGPPVAEVVVDIYANVDFIKIEDLRKNLVRVHLLNKVFMNLSVKRPTAVLVTFISRIMIFIRECILLEQVWGEVCCEIKCPMDEPIRDLFCNAVQLIGQLGEISTDTLNMVRSQNGMPLLLSVLIKSRGMYQIGGDVSSGVGKENSEWWWWLKRRCEKSIFAILGDTCEGTPPLNGRFSSCGNYVISLDTFHKLGDIVPKLNELIQLPDMDLVMRGVRIVSGLCTAICVHDDTHMVLQELGLDKALLHTVNAALRRFLLYSDDQYELDVQQFTQVHALDPQWQDSIYMSMIVIEYMIPLSCDNIKTFFDKDEITQVTSRLKEFGPISGDGERVEKQVKLVDPRLYSWNLEKTDDHPDQLQYLRPLMIDLLRLVIQSDMKYRVYEASAGVAGMEIPPSNSAVEEQCYLTIRITIDCIQSILAVAREWIFSDAMQLTVKSGSTRLIDELLISSLLFIQAIGEIGPTVLSGSIEHVATCGFSLDWQNSSMFSIISAMNNVGFTDSPESITFKKCLFFSDLSLSIGNVPLTSEFCLANPNLWPYISFVGSLIAILGDRDISAGVLAHCIQAISPLLCNSKLNHPCQLVVTDILCAVFLLLGGCVQLLGLIGRFGKVEQQDAYDELVTFIITRGFCREQFWIQWEKDHRVEVQIDPKTGKPIVKKEEKDKKAPAKDKKPDKNAPVIVPVFSELQLNVESTEEYPDPNRGPSKLLWTTLLNQSFACSHLYAEQVNALSAVIVGGRSSLLLSVMINDQTVDLDITDSYGRTSMMYALLLNDEVAIESLLRKHASLNIVDKFGVPTVLYALSTLNSETCMNVFPGHCAVAQTTTQMVCGTSRFLRNLVESGRIDINVADIRGCSPLLFAFGEGFIDVSLGGYLIRVTNFAYSNVEYGSTKNETVRLLIANGCNVNHSTKEGKVSLHIASAEGDIEAINDLLTANANPNAVDAMGWHTFHYTFSCCPIGSIEIFDLVLKAANLRPLNPPEYIDYRTGASESEKLRTELKLHFDETIRDAFLPFSLFTARLSVGELMTLNAKNGLTPLLACAIGSAVSLRNDVRVASDSEVTDRRIKTLLHFLEVACRNECILDLTDKSESPLSLLHGVSILLPGTSPKTELTEKQQRSKRIRFYDSQESKLFLTILENCCNPQPSLWCDFEAPFLAPFHNQWTPFHAILLNGNVDLLDKYIKLFGIQTFASIRPLDVISRFKQQVHDKVADRVVGLCSEWDDWKTHLNEVNDGDQPINNAIQCKQYDVIRALASCAKVSMNVSSTNGLTPIQAVCISGDIKCLEAIQSGGDRIDMTILIDDNCSSPISCVELLTNGDRLDMLKMLVDMRKNDVIELLVSEVGETESLLKRLERKDMNSRIDSNAIVEEEPNTNEAGAGSAIVDYLVELVNSTNFFGPEVHVDDSYVN